MNRIYIYLLLMCCAMPGANAQTVYRTSAGLNAFSLRDISQVYYHMATTANNSLLASAFNGITVKQTIGNKTGLRGTYNVFRGSNYSSGANCYDCFYGTTFVKAFETKLGILRQWNIHRFSFFTGADLYYMERHVWGDYGGGLDGTGRRVNTFNQVRGISPFVGIGWSPVKRVTISVETAFYREWNKSHDLISGRSYKERTAIALNPVNALTLFYNFNMKQ